MKARRKAQTAPKRYRVRHAPKQEDVTFFHRIVEECRRKIMGGSKETFDWEEQLELPLR